MSADVLSYTYAAVFMNKFLTHVIRYILLKAHKSKSNIIGNQLVLKVNVQINSFNVQSR